MNIGSLKRWVPKLLNGMTTQTHDTFIYICTYIHTHTHIYIYTDNGNGNEDRIGEGGREVKNRKKQQNSCRRRAGNGGDLGGKRKKCIENKGLVQ